MATHAPCPLASSWFWPMKEPVWELRGKGSESPLVNYLQAVGLQRPPIFTHGHRWGPSLKATIFSPGSENPQPPFISLGLEGFPGGSDGKESWLQCRRPRFNPWVGKIPGEGNGNPLQYSCLEDPMDRGAWWATVHGVAKSWTRLSNFTHFMLSILENIPWVLEKNVYSGFFFFWWSVLEISIRSNWSIISCSFQRQRKTETFLKFQTREPRPVTDHKQILIACASICEKKMFPDHQMLHNYMKKHNLIKEKSNNRSVLNELTVWTTLSYLG